MRLAWARPYKWVGYTAGNYLSTSSIKYVKNSNNREFVFFTFVFERHGKRCQKELVLSSKK
jgi:hypothetical protein